MAEQWIIRVEGKEYGPADLATLHEWKADGRVLPANPARREDVDLWETAGEIPGCTMSRRGSRPAQAASARAALPSDEPSSTRTRSASNDDARSIAFTAASIVCAMWSRAL